MPTKAYYEGTLRETLAWRIAQAIKDVERTLPAGHLETKEIRNIVVSVLAEKLTLDVDAESGRVRFVTDWTHVGLGEPSDA